MSPESPMHVPAMSPQSVTMYRIAGPPSTFFVTR